LLKDFDFDLFDLFWDSVRISKLKTSQNIALLMVTKYEEIYPPTLKDFIYITGDAYTAEEVLEMERKILFSLDFDISQCSSYRFLERLSKLAKIDSVTFFLS
jgi:hypothetical protein